MSGPDLVLLFGYDGVRYDTFSAKIFPSVLFEKTLNDMFYTRVIHLAPFSRQSLKLVVVLGFVR